MESVLRRDRLLVITGLSVVIALCWGYLLVEAASMARVGTMLMPMSLAPWTLAEAGLMLVMWVVMMAAMMLPSAAPMILLHVTISRRCRARGQGALTSGIFASGYLVIWVLFSVLAVALQYALERVALLSPMMTMTSLIAAGVVLIGAGIYQWTPLKYACLRHCRSPLDFMLTQWRKGAGGAFMMGLRHGMYCVGCCWVLMLLLFVGGVMNLVWIAGLALWVLVEKLAPAGHWLGRGLGVVLVGWGGATLWVALPW
ncbi:metal-binding protein [Litchfieldella qijiaojingensis]|uniref:Metal-binding protein n=2 Tax=Litchfieldella qijiaojingensis TaxID=980347 RepID=A0ABQ2Z5J7_9GAMM|nr:metal-binding protein [Halomonas qijiaojingensis]